MRKLFIYLFIYSEFILSIVKLFSLITSLVVIVHVIAIVHLPAIEGDRAVRKAFPLFFLLLLQEFGLVPTHILSHTRTRTRTRTHSKSQVQAKSSNVRQLEGSRSREFGRFIVWPFWHSFPGWVGMSKTAHIQFDMQIPWFSQHSAITKSFRVKNITSNAK